MNARSKQIKREYSSPLRADQANQTRVRILEAFAEQLVDAGAKDLSIERVAKRAGVSQRTVYYHFPTREALFDAVSTWMDESVGSQGVTNVENCDELVQELPSIFERFDEYETSIRAQLISELGRAVRDRSRSRRRDRIEASVRRSLPDASTADVRRVTTLVHHLTNSETWRSMKDESGMTGREAGETVAWAIQALLAEVRRTGRSTAK